MGDWEAGLDVAVMKSRFASLAVIRDDGGGWPHTMHIHFCFILSMIGDVCVGRCVMSGEPSFLLSLC